MIIGGKFCQYCGEWVGPYGMFHNCKPNPPPVDDIRRVVREEIQKALRELEETRPWQRPW